MWISILHWGVKHGFQSCTGVLNVNFCPWGLSVGFSPAWGFKLGRDFPSRKWLCALEGLNHSRVLQSSCPLREGSGHPRGMQEQDPGLSWAHRSG